MIRHFSDEETDSLTTAATQSTINSPNQRDDCKAETKMTLGTFILINAI